MDQSRDKRIMALVHSCSEMTTDERSEFLEAECGGEVELRREVELILEEDSAKTSSHVLSHHLDANLPDHYKLVGLVGSGGMAEVFLAEDSRLDRRVAIKFLNDTFRRDPDRMRRFNQEARAASALNHPNILTIHDIGEIDGVQYIVSEFVDGETLGTRIGRSKLPPEDVVEIAIQTASALSAAHGAGIVHRDLKPDNIMLRTDGSVKVVDFGLAKSSVGASGAVSDQAHTVEAFTTTPGLILGTPRYMSPEQTRGLPLDGRSDIFSLGIILFEMLTGRSPFGGSNVVDVIANIISREPRRVAEFAPETPPELIAIVDRALQKDREKRYPSVVEVLNDLKQVRSILAGSSQGIRETRRVAAAVPRGGHWKWLVAAAALITLLTVGWYLAGRERMPIVSGAMRSVPITSWSSVSAEAVSSASFSPDARMVAFASTKSGPSEIWVKQVAGGEAVQVTKNSFYNQYPVWSPDGQEIAFYSGRGDHRGIWKVAFTGGPESQLVSAVNSQAKPIRWSADKSLFYADGPEIFALETGSGVQSKLTDLASSGLDPRALAVSADGSSFAISVKEDGMWKVKTRRFDGSAFTEMATSKDQIANIAFQPNGRDIFYTGGIDGTYQIFAAAPGSSPVQVSSGNSDLSLHDISADGSKVLYNSVTESSDLWSITLAGGKETIVANDTSEEYWADISPDGNSVTYQAVTQPDRPFRGSIWVKSFTGGNAAQVAAEGFSPVWSPDGEWIAFFRRSSAGTEIWKVRPTGADAVRLAEGAITTPGYLTVPYLKTTGDAMRWSPDGSSLVYAAKADGVSNIFMIKSDGRGTRMVSNNRDANENLWCADWGPDGLAFASEVARVYRSWVTEAGDGPAKIVFDSKDPFRILGWVGKELLIAQNNDVKDRAQAPASTNVFAVSPATGSRRIVTVLPNAYSANIHLSKRRDRIAFTVRANNMSELWTVPVGGGSPKKILSEGDPKILFSSLAWTPNGNSLIYGKQTRTNVLSMLIN